MQLDTFKTQPSSLHIRQNLAKAGIVEEAADSPGSAAIVLVPMPKGSIRFCTDFRKLNSLTVPDPFRMPRVEGLIDVVQKVKFLVKLNTTRGF